MCIVRSQTVLFSVKLYASGHVSEFYEPFVDVG